MSNVVARTQAIVSQINLLALNATVEAARGEAGARSRRRVSNK